ncbi:hypothetical protein [Pelotalea chapellei]|uniref:Uncharacterized protein n=1 Tax=Pelotalea chapellei TaxID=44671 RepID=A0ABS5UAC2_9BACT|nr:hypothetical protein [Pelotalea chapellei]MBT1072591.1 hypothetical protein [Pelotalea chapellei]
MKRYRIKIMCLALMLAIMGWGVAPGIAQPPDTIQAGAAVDQTIVQERKKPPRQKRQEAKKRLQEAIQARKASQLAEASAIPIDNPGNGKGSAK